MNIDKIYNMDCLAGMAEMQPASVDAIITDLPFGTTQNKWDCIIPMEALWNAWRRVCKPETPIILFTQIPFALTVMQSNPKWLRYEWLWIKPNGTGFLNANRAPLKVHENILVFYDKAPIYNPQMRTGHAYYKIRSGRQSGNYHAFDKCTTVSNGERFPVDVLYYDREPHATHPTQKPVALIEYLIKTYTNRGGLVLDCCMGSGTTAIAAIKTARHFIGFETDAKYYGEAVARIERETSEPPLFYNVE